MKKLSYDKKQITIVVLVIIFFFMILGLNSRLSELFRLSDQQSIMQTKVASLKNTDIALNTQIAIATSDLAVEAWARDQGHMAQPGDNVIIPLQPSFTTQDLSYLPTKTTNPMEDWQIWWDLFFSN
jgi:cell division protein FtsB